MSRSIASLRARARFRVRARPMKRMTASRIVVIVGVALFVFFAAICAAVFAGVELDPDDPTPSDPDLVPYAWIPTAAAAAGLLGLASFLVHRSAAWRIGVVLLLVALIAPLVALVAAVLRESPSDPVVAAIVVAILFAYVVAVCFAIALDARRRLRQDRFR